MLVPLLVFALTYLAVSGVRLPLLGVDRTSAALAGAVAMVLAGGLPIRDAYTAINLDTIVLLFGMMVITACLVEARFFERLAWETAARASSPRALLLLLVLVAGALSALFVNDTICVMFTPLVVAVVEAAELPALPYLLALSTSTNLGGVATFTGNPQNMIIGTHAGISFGRYFARLAPVAAIGLALDALLLLLLFRRVLSPVGAVRPRSARPELDRPLLLRAGAALVLALVGFFGGFSLAGTALLAASLLLLGSGRPPRLLLERVNFPLLVFFAALFVVVAGVVHAGALHAVNAWLLPRLGARPEAQLVNFGAASVVGSNLFSNVPYVLLGLEVVPRLLDPERGFLVLAMASTLAGNLTIFGSVANLIVLESAGPHGRVGFLTFLRYGLPITVATTAVGLGVLLVEARLGW